jgi:Ca2+-binding RTX toxin-like protein
MAGNFLYTIDWGDGVIETNVPGTAVLEREHTYATLGAKVIKATVREAVNGTNSAQATFSVNVSPVSEIDGALIVSGTSSSDRIVIQPGGTGVSVRINNKLVPTPPFSTKIVVLGLAGADTVTVSGSIGAPVEIYGGEGSDYLTGGGGDDLIDGGNGHDRLYGGKGDDNLVGGAGNDSLYGGAGNDTLDGGLDKDLVQGDAGDDTALGGDGDDRVLGVTGNDYLSGDEGNDRVEGGAGDDLLLGRTGGDRLYGGTGNDVLLGGSESDTLYGGTGDDLLAGDTTTNDEDEFALAFIWSTWSAGAINAVPDLEAEFNDGTIPDNDGFDILYGEGGSDWLLHFISDTLKIPGSTDVKQLLPTV